MDADVLADILRDELQLLGAIVVDERVPAAAATPPHNQYRLALDSDDDKVFPFPDGESPRV